MPRPCNCQSSSRARILSTFSQFVRKVPCILSQWTVLLQTLRMWCKKYLHSVSKETFLHGFCLGPNVRVMWPWIITPDSLVYTLLQKKGNFQNVAFLLRKSVVYSDMTFILQVLEVSFDNCWLDYTCTEHLWMPCTLSCGDQIISRFIHFIRKLHVCRVRPMIELYQTLRIWCMFHR